jgi:V8-like Glu-specific endopeptidase
MTGIKRSPGDFSIEELDRELIARGAKVPDEKRFYFRDTAGTPARDEIMEQTAKLYRPDNTPLLNETLSHLSMRQLTETLILKIREAESDRAARGHGIRMDMYEISDRNIKRIAHSVVSIWMKDNVEDNHNGFFSLRHKQYGESFNLHRSEPYYKQPIAEGRLCTGFLVGENVIATAGHCADERNVKALRFVFGYEMKGSHDPVTQVPDKDIYNGEEIIRRVYDPGGSGADWALVKLDRNVTERHIVTLSKTGIRRDHPVYVLGHPCGLPLKYVPDEPVTGMDRAFFSAELTVYGGNSGSPVFSSETHEVVGILVRGDQQNFRWTGSGWMSVRYPNPRLKSNAPQCTRVSEFFKYCP